jgi:hypothetical protein
MRCNGIFVVCAFAQIENRKEHGSRKYRKAWKWDSNGNMSALAEQLVSRP